MERYRPPRGVARLTTEDIDEIEAHLAQRNTTDWEELKPLGEGGQSNVFLVRAPKRANQRTECLKKIRTSLDGDKRAELAEAIWSYVRPDEPDEMGALKVFKIPPEDAQAMTPAPGSEEYRAIERLKNEIAMLGQNRAGLPKLLYSDVAKRRIVTEYFPERSLERHLTKYRGDAPRALSAFRSIVETVTSLHKEGYVHRDIKPANIFVRSDDKLVLGDFGIVFVPGQADRVTFTEERVGPRDYMPQWGDLGERLENVQPSFDVYMLGKLLWCMNSGRLKLPREYHHRKGFDLTGLFPNDPHMHFVNAILDRCIVEEPHLCLPSAEPLLTMVDEVLSIIRRGGQFLGDGVPRPCRVCGKGEYGVLELTKGSKTVMMRLWISGGANDIALVNVQPFICSACGHIEFFRTH
jgi:serine/threonine protein kinase